MTLYCPVMALQFVVAVYVTKQHVLLRPLVEVPVPLSDADLVELPLVAQAKHHQVSLIPH